MGCYSESCAVSNLPISVGDKVLWIYAKPSWVKTTHDLSNLVWRHAEKIQECIKFQLANEEFAQKYPETKIEPLWDSFWTIPPEKEFEWGFGEYDDYGWVEGEECDDEYFDGRILVRKDVADKIAAFGKTLISDAWYEKKPYLVDNYLYCFLLVCHRARIHLFGHRFLGRQSPDGDEMKEQKVVRRIINRELTKLSNKIFMEELEYKNWSWRVGVEYKIRRIVKFLLGDKK